MPAPTTTSAFASFLIKPSASWLSKLGLPRRRRARHLTPQGSPSRSFLQHSVASSGAGSGGRAGFSEVFRRFDADGDGKISGAELVAFLTSVGEDVTPGGVERVVRDLDSDGDGLLDYGDFVRLIRGGGREEYRRRREEVVQVVELGDDQIQEEEDLRAAFEMFVAPEKGGAAGWCITPAGLRRALGRLGEKTSPEECSAMIRAFDADGNGVLDYQEFYRMMTTT